MVRLALEHVLLSLLRIHHEARLNGSEFLRQKLYSIDVLNWNVYLKTCNLFESHAQSRNIHIYFKDLALFLVLYSTENMT